MQAAVEVRDHDQAEPAPGEIFEHAAHLGVQAPGLRTGVVGEGGVEEARALGRAARRRRRTEGVLQRGIDHGAPPGALEVEQGAGVARRPRERRGCGERAPEALVERVRGDLEARGAREPRVGRADRLRDLEQRAAGVEADHLQRRARVVRRAHQFAASTSGICQNWISTPCAERGDTNAVL